VKGKEFSDLRVPSLIMTPTDVSRLSREITALDDYMGQEGLRHPGEPQGKLPKTSRLLDELAQTNSLNLLEQSTRQHLGAFLADVAANAPVVHISFASDPSSAFLQKIVIWFRDNVHPSVLVRVGLQPTIAAGCALQTTNQYFDLSLRRYLQQNKDDLIAHLRAKVEEPGA
jgi:hypothetical protein